MVTINSLFELAIDFRDKGRFRDSVNVLSKILTEFPADKQTHRVYSVLGGVYADLEENENAFTNFKKASELNPQSELASLGLYVALVKLDRDEEAIGEMTRFLTAYPADLYKDTLEELLEGVKRGYLANYEEDIKKLARANGIII